MEKPKAIHAPEQASFSDLPQEVRLTTLHELINQPLKASKFDRINPFVSGTKDAENIIASIQPLKASIVQ